MLKEVKTKIVMDSGKEYIVSMHPELFAIHITDEFGNILRGMLQFDNIFINPQHISSLEAVNFEVFTLEDIENAVG